jgi:hypothetical protein
MSYEIHKQPQVHGSAAEQVRLQIEHLKRTVKSPYELIEHVIQLYAAEFEKLQQALAEQQRYNDELFLLKQRVVIANRELMARNAELSAQLGVPPAPAALSETEEAATLEAHRRKAEDTPC